MNITMCISRIAACCFGALVPGLACAAISLAPPSLPPCAFADTEASSNFVFGTGTDLDRNWILAIEADVSSNNNVQVEFGGERVPRRRHLQPLQPGVEHGAGGRPRRKAGGRGRQVGAVPASVCAEAEVRHR